MSQLFTPGTGFWGIGADRSRRLSSKAARCCIRNARRKAAYEQAAEQYRSTVLTAFQNVADTLTALSRMPKH